LVAQRIPGFVCFLEALRVEYKCSSILGLCRFAEEQIKFEKNYEPVSHENDLLWVCVFNQQSIIIQPTVPVLQWKWESTRLKWGGTNA
jgi:hypothetical protein